jgi:hypothetical protein
MKRLLISVLTILLFSSCSSLRLASSEHKSSIKDVIRLDGCKKPCWLGIEQGIALEIDSVEHILKSYYGEKNANINNDVGKNPTFGFHSVVWRIDTKSDTIPLQYGSVTLNKDGQVDSIDVWLEEQWFTVGDLISLVGEPDLAVMINVNNYPGGSPCDVWKLHYPDIGLSVIVWQDESTGKIEKSSHIASLFFTKPWLASETAENKLFDKLVKWNGYGDYSQYCTKVKTPSP